MSDGYHAVVVRGPLESLRALAQGGREMGIEVVTGPFLVDSPTQTELIPLVCSLNSEKIEADRQRFARRDSA